ncbi:MAG: GNAT family N-acetyltransferase [Bacteroidota bacterium]
MIAETERLILREMTPDDAQFAFDLNSNPEVVQYTGDGPFDSVEQAREFLENYSDYQRNGFGRWGVVLKETGKLIGWCGLKRDRETGEVDLGYRFFQENWNKGFATEASIACLEIGKTNFGLERVIARARKENPASYKVMEKLGFTFEKDYLEDDETWVLYAITLSE